ncbi:hypothetical protein CC86DRAFT_378658 [Ophiobolus disseminans]|uniref:Uncharacterized protein n=1 Tax=Ophiobolus disseminans TaxID=1469910 RepID=A0A6A7AAW7_9PLEO|nr:hypothetical protein CC86DRAFT_378658 [Ophiobolus disseminans]
MSCALAAQSPDSTHGVLSVRIYMNSIGLYIKSFARNSYLSLKTHSVADVSHDREHAPSVATPPTTISEANASYGCHNDPDDDGYYDDGYDDEPEVDISSNIAIYPNMAGNDEEEGDDEGECEDNYEDRNNPEYIQPLLGVRLANNKNLWAHLRKDKGKRWRHDHNGAPPPPSEFDKDGEYLDYKYIRSIVRADGSEGAELAALPCDEDAPCLPDGTKAIIKEMYDVYYKKRRGQATFDGATVAEAFMLVRDDLSDDPYHFALSTQGVEAARALHAYQEDQEQLENRPPVDLHERAMLETGLPIWDHSAHLHDLHDHLHHNPCQNDSKIAEVMEYLAETNYHDKKAELEWYQENYPDKVACGNGIRLDTEKDVILDILHHMPATAKLSADELEKAGLCRSEDEYGANPEYTDAKRKWWAANRCIYTLEAIVRHTFKTVRALRSPLGPDGFLTQLREADINSRLPEYPDESKKIYVPLDNRKIFEILRSEFPRRDPPSIRHWCS